MLLNLEGFKYALSLYLNMCYYHIRLSEQASNLCTIILLWGNYRYKPLPMGVSNSPDIFQEKMNEIFRDFEFIRAYIDDLLIITKGDWSDHSEKLEQTLQKLKDNGIKFNIEKSSFGQTEMESLGFWVTRIEIRPINKKVESIVNMTPPKNMKQVWAFIGVINYYRDMWARRSHILHPLMALTSPKVRFKWISVEEKSFY